GRESSNRLAISDLSLSRRHCQVARDADRYKLTDLDSLNGTFVNEVPVKERWLEHGDRIRLGDSIFLFLLHEGEPPLLSGEVKLSDEEPQHDSTIMLRREEALYLDSARVQAALPQESRMARHLNALLGISAVINAAKNIEALEQ